MAKRRRRFRAAYFFGSLPLLLGLWVFSLGVRGEIRNARIASWPRAWGHALWLENGTDTSLVFDYVANGTKYRLTWFRSSDSGYLEPIRLQYPKGSVFAVRYDPKNPVLSLLETDGSGQGHIFFGTGLVLFSCASVFLIGYWRADQGLSIGDRHNHGVFPFNTTRDPLTLAMLQSTAAFCVSLGLFCIGDVVVSSWKSVRASYWQTVAAEIVHTQVDVSIPDASKPWLIPMVAYRYVVNGETYTSSQRRFGETGTTIEHMVATYPAGTRVVAFYSPDNPQIAVLETDFDLEQLKVPALGLLPALFAVLFRSVVHFFSGRSRHA